MRPWKEDPEPDILEMTQRKAEEEQIRTQEDEVCEEEMDGKMSEDDWIDTGEEEGKVEEVQGNCCHRGIVSANTQIAQRMRENNTDSFTGEKEFIVPDVATAVT